jgi:hypothetical protein
MKRVSRPTSVRWARIRVHLVTVPLLTAAAAAAAVGIGLDTAAPAAADTTSMMQLQIQMKHGENRQYTVVGNVMKTKHDTVKNSIGNVR